MSEKAGIPLWPRPRQCKTTNRNLRLDKPFTVAIRGDSPWLAVAARKAVAALRQAGLATATGKASGATLTLADMAALPKDKGPAPVRQAEGYVLSITPRGIVLAGADARGFFYGVKALEQMVSAADGNLPGVEVRDWPAKPLRGVHLYLPARKQLPFMLDFIDFLGRNRLNTLFLEVGAAMQFESHPELNRAWRKFARFAMTYTADQDPDPATCDPDRWEPKKFPKGPYALMCSRRGYLKDSIHPDNGMGDVLTHDEVRRILRACRRNHIEIIPEVQALSHTYWMCIAHPDIAERADDPWPDTYCPSNPKTYKILFDVLDEVAALFRPKTIHIGHDELWSIGLCPKCRGTDIADLLAGDITRVHDHLAPKGIRTALWGDKLMTTDVFKRATRAKRNDSIDGFTIPDTWRAVDKIPQDVLITDWYWSLNPESVTHFGARNMQVAFGNFSPYSMKEWDARAKPANVVGAEVSTWCEVAPEAYGHNNVLEPMLAGAEILWRGKYQSAAQLRERMSAQAVRETERFFGFGRALAAGAASQPLDLSAAMQPLPAALSGGIGTGAESSAVVGGARFRFAADKKGALAQAVVLSQAQPRSRAVSVNAKAKRLLFVHASTLENVFNQRTYHNWLRPAAVILRYRVKYADGKSAVVAARYPRDIANLKNEGSTVVSYASVGLLAGKGHAFYVQEWANPRPGAKIASITAELGPDATDVGEVLIPAINVVG